jgi:hypothetical protein
VAWLVTAVALVVAPGARIGSSPAQSARSVRFHHLHYTVGDPSAAMTEAAARLEGVRVILQGLGVGVRSGREFVLFDRASAPEVPRPHRPAASAITLAAERLKAWGLDAGSGAPADDRIASLFRDLPVDHVAFTADDFDGLLHSLKARQIRPISSREDSALFDPDDGPRIEIVRDTEREETFWCPMHPDVRSAGEGKCPVCGMALVPIPPPKIGEYKFDVSQMIDARGFRGLTLAVREPDTGARVSKFAVVHEKPFHLFIVSRDLKYFAHVHPDDAADGSLTLRHRLPAGEYMLIADFLPIGGTSQMVQKAIIVTARGAAATVSDESNGLKVALQTEALAAGKHARLTFTVSDAKTGAAVTDLEPYLGAPAHMLIVRADLSDAIHAHPEELTTSGPTVSFHPIMPARGAYKGWIQFQRQGKVSTTAFELTVER